MPGIIKGVALDKLEKPEGAIKAYEQTIKINPDNAYAYSSLGELFFRFGNLEDASINVKRALEKDKNLVSALRLQGRIKIEEKQYDEASKCFERAISLDIGNPILLIWNSYARFLNLEFSNDIKDKKYQEGLISIIRNLEKIDILSKKLEKEIRAHILYFLGSFYLKGKDVIAAKEKLEECIRLKSRASIEASARELLGNIWNYQIRPHWLRWWLNSPLYKWPKRIGFFFLSLSIPGLLIIHPFIHSLFPSIQVNLTLYVMLIVLLIILLTLPNLERIKAKDIEIELRSPPPFESVLSPMVMEKELKKMEEKFMEFKKLQ